MKLIEFKVKDITFSCIVKNNQTAKKIISILPFKASVSTWGDEIYFTLPKQLDIMLENNAKDVFELGQIAFWTEGNSIAIGFGPTPASISNEIRLVTKCNYWADSLDPIKLTKLKSVVDGDIITIKAI